MINPIYNLPRINFVGGETQTFMFNLRTKEGNSFNANECEAEFALISYSGKNRDPVLTKDANIVSDDYGLDSVASVSLNPSETVNLHGKYIYQLTIRDKDGNIEIPGQGFVDIIRNIHPGFIIN